MTQKFNLFFTATVFYQLCIDGVFKMILKMKNFAKKLELDEHFGVSAWENVTNLSI